MQDRSNTMAGWVLAAGIVALGGSILFGKMFNGEAPEHGHQGYVIQGVEAAGGGGAAAVPLPVLLASADATKGEAIFKKCVSCHTITPGGANGIGPNLHAILGDGVGTGRGGFAFSDDLKAKGGKWDFEMLDAWLSNPKKFAPATKMNFAGLGNPKERADLEIYLNAQGSNLPLPAAPAADAPAAEDAKK